MLAKKILYALLAALFLSSCAYLPKAKENKVVFKSRTIYANEAETIGLQNLNNRVVVYCHSNFFKSADSCAEYFEQRGYTRFRDIPYKTANFDFLTLDTYPTRRWRDSERTPRW